ATRQSRPIVSKLTQTTRTGADSTEAPSVCRRERRRAATDTLGQEPRAERQRPRDQRADDDPRRLGHADDLDAGEDERRRERDAERAVGQVHAELAADQDP